MCSGLLSQRKTVGDEHGASAVGTKETTVYIDKTITIREVTSVGAENAIGNSRVMSSSDTMFWLSSKVFI